MCAVHSPVYFSRDSRTRYSGAHTDTTFLTVIPCASAPGLEVLQPSTGRWLRPEAAGDAEPGADVMLLAGELLQVLGRGSYQAAVHRVVRPAGLTEPRISTPLLVRGSANVAVPDSMLPAFVAIACAAIGAEVLPAARAMNTSAQAWQKITMKDLWAALQFRAEPSDETPLAHSRLGQEHEIRQIFGPFAPAGLNVLSLDPLLVRLHGFASAADCRTIIEKASASMAESKTWGSADEQDEASGVRKSSTAWVSDGSLPLLEVLTARVAVLSGLPSTFMEKWQVRAGGRVATYHSWGVRKTSLVECLTPQLQGWCKPRLNCATVLCVRVVRDCCRCIAWLMADLSLSFFPGAGELAGIQRLRRRIKGI